MIENESPAATADGRDKGREADTPEDTTGTPENQSVDEPEWLPVQADNIPAALRDIHRWVCWWGVFRAPKWTKPPHQVNGQLASVADAATWTDFQSALAAYQSGKLGFRGVGLMLNGDGIVGIDLDNCIEGRKINAEATKIIRQFASYTELSPSGTGIRIFCYGKLPEGRRKNGDFEVYATARFLTVTGHRIPGTPAAIRHAQDAIDCFYQTYIEKPGQKETPPSSVTIGQGSSTLTDDEVIAKATACDRQGLKFDALWCGKWQALYPSQSEADLALCAILAFWCNKDAEQIDRLFRRSALMRDKWDRRHGNSTYGETTIQKAIASDSRVYDPENGRSAAMATGGQVVIVPASEIAPRAIPWLWPGYLAQGMLALLAGSPGTGKTTVALTWVAAISSGGKFPDGCQVPHGTVLIWSGEDPINEVLVPRLLAAGADLSRIGFISTATERGQSRAFDPAMDIPILAEEIRKRPDVKLIILDPIISAVRGDAHRNNEVRRALQPIVDLAASCDVAVLGISHFSKGTRGQDPAERINGSIGFTALARVVMATAADADGNGYVLTRAKSNIGPTGGGFRYRLAQTTLPGHPDVMASTVEWLGKLTGSAQELICDAEEAGEEKGATTDAEFFLKLELEAGAVPAREVKRAARDAGITEKTLYRAKDRLKIKSRKLGMNSGWAWELPTA